MTGAHPGRLAHGTARSGKSPASPVADGTDPADQAGLVAGPVVDEQTRCVHWHGPLDVVAIRLPCCAPFWPCHTCHEQTADHQARTWPTGSDDVAAVLCGVCHHVLRIADYRRVDGCPRCAAPFNPGCRTHHHLYFG